MMFVVIFKPVVQLAHDRSRIRPVMNEHIVPLERLYKGLCHAVTLRTVGWGTAHPHIDAAGEGSCVAGKIVQAIIREPFNGLRKCVDRTKAILQRLQHQITDGLRTDPAGGGDIAEHFPITAVQAEDDPDHLFIPATDLEDVTTPAMKLEKFRFTGITEH